MSRTAPITDLKVVINSEIHYFDSNLRRERMKKIFITLLAVTFSGLYFFAEASERTINIQIGPLWPHVLKESSKPTAWNSSLQIGRVIDRKIAIGTDINFLWNNYSDEEMVIGNISQVSSKQKTLCFPITAFLSITPFPDLIVYPGISGQIGLNTMYYSNSTDSIKTDNSMTNGFDENGWYMGLIGKIGASAYFAFSNNSTIFAGMEYLWSNPKKISRKRTDNLVARRKMSGFGLKFGIGLLL